MGKDERSGNIYLSCGVTSSMTTTAIIIILLVVLLPVLFWSGYTYFSIAFHQPEEK